MSTIPQLYSGMWLPLSLEVKKEISELFNISRTGPSHVVDNQVQSDGYSEQELSKVNVPSLQGVLDSKEKDFFVLWNMLLTRIDEKLHPEKYVLEKEEPLLEDVTTQTPHAESKKSAKKKQD